MGSASLSSISAEATMRSRARAHRGGPLAEGMVAGEEVICPWRGSRFNVKTGSVLTPPAQQGVKSFPVRVTGDDVEVEVEVDLLSGVSSPLSGVAFKDTSGGPIP